MTNHPVAILLMHPQNWHQTFNSPHLVALCNYDHHLRNMLIYEEMGIYEAISIYEETNIYFMCIQIYWLICLHKPILV